MRKRDGRASRSSEALSGRIRHRVSELVFASTGSKDPEEEALVLSRFNAAVAGCEYFFRASALETAVAADHAHSTRQRAAQDSFQISPTQR